MAELFDITHEGNNLDEYDATITDGGDLSVTGAAALAGTNFGLQGLIDNITAIYGTKNLSDPGSDFRFRFYYDPNTHTINTNFHGYNIMNARLSAAPDQFVVFYYQRNDPNTNVVCLPYDDSGSLTISSFSISDAPHYIEFYAQRATGVAANDGAFEWWVDGDSKGTWANVDNWDMFPLLNALRVGFQNINNSVSGTIFLDQIKANDDGSEIGAHVVAGNVGIMTTNTGYWGPTF